MVTELRNVESDVRKGHIVIRGTPQRLMNHLMEDNSSVDASYTEDFLLTYRTFLSSPLVIANQLVDWFKDPQLRDKVTRVLLLWVNNHFTDFEMDKVKIWTNFVSQNDGQNYLNFRFNSSKRHIYKLVQT
jgi:hypothetical protein